MEEENNNLGDFFRRRLSSDEGGDEDWFNPDPRVDERVLQGLAASSIGKRKKKKWLLILLPCFAFLGMLGYIIHLKQQIALLNDITTPTIAQKTSVKSPSTITTKNTARLNNIPVITNAKKETPIDKKVSLKDKKKEQAILWNNLKAKNETLQQQIEQKNKIIQALQLELSQNCAQVNPSKNRLANTKESGVKYLSPNLDIPSILTTKTASILDSKTIFAQNKWNDFLADSEPTEIGEANNQIFENLPTIKPGFLTVPLEKTEAIPDYSFSLKKKKKRKLNSLEIGLHLGVQALFTEKEVKILDQRVLLKDDLASIELAVPYIGLNIAYSPIKNLWIRTGLQVGGNTDNMREEIGIVYNDAQEYLLPSGDRGSDLVLNTSTGYTKAANTLEVTIPSTTTNGDLLELDYEERLSIKHLQIPLSVEYFFGQKKWQPFIHLGVKWNLFHYEYKASKMDVRYENQGLDFEFNEGNSNAKILQYMSLMTGVGMNCNLRPRLSLRATIGLEMNHLLNEKLTNTVYSRNGLSANFGLYYKF